MKIKKITTTEWYIDLKKERRRIHKCFKNSPNIRDRQLAIIDAFEQKQPKKGIDLYDALPYDGEDECSEKEYVGLWLGIFTGSAFFGLGKSEISYDKKWEIDGIEYVE